MEDEEHGVLGKTFCKSKTSNEINSNADTVAVPLHERKWVDVNPGSYDHECYVITQAMTRLLRHDQNIPWETDGAVKYEDIVEEFNKKKRKKFEGAPQWSLNDWISFLAKGGGAKKRFQYCLNPNSSRHISYFRAIQGHSGALLLILSCKTKNCLPKGFTEYIYHVGNVSEVHPRIRSG